MFFRINREPACDVTIGGINVPKGIRIDIPLSGIHYDPEIYPEPEQFKPERWAILMKHQNIKFLKLNCHISI